jgi:hypothetical protein
MKQQTFATVKGFEKHNRKMRKEAFLLRMYFRANWFNLADESCEEALDALNVFSLVCSAHSPVRRAGAGSNPSYRWQSRTRQPQRAGCPRPQENQLSWQPAMKNPFCSGVCKGSSARMAIAVRRTVDR